MDQRARTAFLGLLLFLAAPAFAFNGDEHRARYNFPNASAKLVDNKGDGFDPLYFVESRTG